MVTEGEVLWKPGAEWIERSYVTEFSRWLEANRKLKFANYAELWQWSITDLEAFWGALWDFFRIQPSVPYERVLGNRKMPGTEWFPGARLNYAEHALRHERPGVLALQYLSERRPLTEMMWDELGGKVRVLATQLR